MVAATDRVVDAGWRARITLGFERVGAVTRLRRGPGHGPLYVQKPFYPENPCTHVYLVHPPGGIVGGDRLDIDVQLATDAAALITTPAATKLYRVAATKAQLTQRFRVSRGACLEWLPLETIVFDGADFSSHTEIMLEPGARFFGWEMTCLGRPAGNRPFATGRIHQRVALRRRDGPHLRPLLLDNAQLSAPSSRQSAPWGYAGASVAASAWLTPATRELGAAINATLADSTPDLALTVPGDVLVVRALGNDAEHIMEQLRRFWSVARELAFARSAVAPRIWNT